MPKRRNRRGGGSTLLAPASALSFGFGFGASASFDPLSVSALQELWVGDDYTSSPWVGAKAGIGLVDNRDVETYGPRLTSTYNGHQVVVFDTHGYMISEAFAPEVEPPFYVFASVLVEEPWHSPNPNPCYNLWDGYGAATDWICDTYFWADSADVQKLYLWEGNLGDAIVNFDWTWGWHTYCIMYDGLPGSDVQVDGVGRALTIRDTDVITGLGNFVLGAQWNVPENNLNILNGLVGAVGICDATLTPADQTALETWFRETYPM